MNHGESVSDGLPGEGRDGLLSKKTTQRLTELTNVSKTRTCIHAIDYNELAEKSKRSAILKENIREIK